MNNLFQPTSQLKISITQKCNNDCLICLNKTTRSRKNRPNIISIEKIKSLIDEASDLGMIGTYWTGGEPLLEYNNLLEVIHYSKEKKMLPTIVSNGGLIGAYGKYKEMNKDLLTNSGLYYLSIDEIVNSLTEAGLTRIYFSVDYYHTTLESVNSDIYNKVPTEVIEIVINKFLDKGFGKKHKLEVIGHRLRITATSSGPYRNSTYEIIDDIINRAKLKFVNGTKEIGGIMRNKKGEIFLKSLEVATIGDAETLDNKFLENKSGLELVDNKCTHFKSRNSAYDNGKYHGDLYIDNNGDTYTCGNHAYKIGNVYEESLKAIIDGVNNPDRKNKYALNRKIYHSLLMLSQENNIGMNVLGEAIRLINTIDRNIVKSIRTECGVCNCLGKNKVLQEIFLKAFKKRYFKM